MDIGEKTMRRGAAKKGKGLKVALAALVALVVAGGGFFAYRALQLKPPPATTAAPKAGAETPVQAGVGPPAAPAVLELTSVPSGATVMAGTTVLGSTPVTINTLLPGTEHTLVVEKRNYEAKELRVELAAGEVREESVTLVRRKAGKKGRKGGRGGKADAEPVAAAPAAKSEAGTGFLTCKTTPYTTVFFNGKSLGETPFARKPLPAGTHTLRFVNAEESVDERRPVTIEAEKVTKFKPKFK